MDLSLPRRAVIGVRFAASDFEAGGMRVAAVVPRSMAARAGLRAGDKLERIEDMPILAPVDLSEVARKIGDSPTATLTFSRGDERYGQTAEVQRWPDESYRGCAVEYGAIVAAGDARLRLIVVSPAQARSCVLYLAGIGLDSIEAAAQPLLGKLVGELAVAGVATARLERRGVGDSDGGPAELVDFETERADVAPAITALRGRFEKLVVLGHSVGGMIAPFLADCDAVAAYGSSARPWFDCVEASARRQLSASGQSAEETDSLVAAQRRTWQNRESDDERPFVFHEQLDQAGVAAAWERTSIPVLSLWGELDHVVSVDEAEEISRLAPRGAYVSLAGLDHGGGPDPSALASALASWLRDTVGE